MQMIKIIPLALLLGAPSFVVANDFPTRDRVEYVLHCLQEMGENTMDELQTCSCRIDSIASEMSFEIYGYAVTYNRNKRMTGEKGGVFRDNKAGKNFSKGLKVAEDTAKGQCIKVVHIVAPTDLTQDKKYLEIRVQ
jgi:hypothetical protein